MIKAIINGILNILMTIIDIVLTPLNLLFDNFFPDVSQVILSFNSFVSRFVGPTFTWVFNLFPPTFKTLLITFFTLVIGYYGIYYTYLGIKKIFDIIQKIKLW